MNIDIKHIARLSRLHFREEDVQRFQKEMEGIIHMVEHLPEPSGQNLEVDRADAMELRRDEIRPSMAREDILANAPRTAAGCVVVPKTVE